MKFFYLSFVMMIYSNNIVYANEFFVQLDKQLFSYHSTQKSTDSTTTRISTNTPDFDFRVFYKGLNLYWNSKGSLNLGQDLTERLEAGLILGFNDLKTDDGTNNSNQTVGLYLTHYTHFSTSLLETDLEFDIAKTKIEGNAPSEETTKRYMISFDYVQEINKHFKYVGGLNLEWLQGDSGSFNIGLTLLSLRLNW